VLDAAVLSTGVGGGGAGVQWYLPNVGFGENPGKIP